MTTDPLDPSLRLPLGLTVPTPGDALRRLGLRLGRSAKLRSGAEAVVRWLEPPPPPVATPPERAPRVGPASAVEDASPTAYHDPGASPIEVRVTQGVVDRLLADTIDHVRGPRGQDETGWVPIGRVEGGRVVVEGLLPKGRGSRATPGDFEIDHGHVLAALALAQTRAAAQVVGLVHTHPGRMDWNSSLDLAADEAHVLTLPGRIGVYPIVVRERGAAQGRVLHAGLRLAWWGMRASRPGRYAPCRLEVVPGDDAGAWLVEHDDALAEAGDVVLGLLERQVEATVLAAPAGGVDLVATLGPSSVVVRFDPEPGAPALAVPDGARRLEGVTGQGRRLAARLHQALTEAVAGRLALPAGGRRGAPRRGDDVRNTPPHPSKRTERLPHDRSGRSRGTPKRPRNEA